MVTAASRQRYFLYDRFSSSPIASLYGDAANAHLGSHGITSLANNNYVIASPIETVYGVVNAGSVRLVNGDTGEQISAALVGDAFEDFLGIGSIGRSSTSINTQLANSRPTVPIGKNKRILQS